MIGFRCLLVVQFSALLVYTLAVGYEYGFGLLQVFFGDILTLTWPGQFNLDFLFMLLFSALWLSWRERFSIPGLGIAVLGLFGGALFLSAYLFYLSFRVDGSFICLLLGKQFIELKS